MSSDPAPCGLDPSPSRVRHALTHQLLPGTVLSLPAKTNMVLVVMQGTAWVTCGQGPHGAFAASTALHPTSGDGCLASGQAAPVAAGAQVVLEAMGDMPLQFVWVPAVQWSSAAASSGRDGQHGGWWQRVAGSLRRARARQHHRSAMPYGLGLSA